MLSYLLLLVCALIGGLISLYFTLVYYGRIRPDHWLVPPVCRMDEGTCRRIIFTPEAKLLILPNFVWGLAYYFFIILFVLSPIESIVPQLRLILSTASTLTVLLAVYLSYALIVRLKTFCVLCYTSHVVNLTIFIILNMF